mgnify:CR=1 FL=1
MITTNRDECWKATSRAGVGATCCPSCHTPDDPRLPEWVREQEEPMFRPVRLYAGGTYRVCCEVWKRVVDSKRGVFADEVKA